MPATPHQVTSSTMPRTNTGMPRPSQQTRQAFMSGSAQSPQHVTPSRPRPARPYVPQYQPRQEPLTAKAIAWVSIGGIHMLILGWALASA